LKIIKKSFLRLTLDWVCGFFFGYCWLNDMHSACKYIKRHAPKV
jgi:hypothetical protein